MDILSTRYGHTRQAAISAKVAALQARFAPVAIEAPAPVLSLVPAATVETRAQYRTRMAAFQIERAQLRAELPLLRSALIEAAFYADFEGYGGPSPDEIEAMQSRLDALGDYLIMEIDPAFDAMPMLLAA